LHPTRTQLHGRRRCGQGDDLSRRRAEVDGHAAPVARTEGIGPQVRVPLRDQHRRLTEDLAELLDGAAAQDPLTRVGVPRPATSRDVPRSHPGEASSRAQETMQRFRRRGSVKCSWCTGRERLSRSHASDQAVLSQRSGGDESRLPSRLSSASRAAETREVATEASPIRHPGWLSRSCRPSRPACRAPPHHRGSMQGRAHGERGQRPACTHRSAKVATGREDPRRQLGGEETWPRIDPRGDLLGHRGGPSWSHERHERGGP